jgi:hypothetical protein
VQKLDEIFCRHHLVYRLNHLVLELELSLSSRIYWFFLFGWPIYWGGEVLKSPTTTMLESIYVFRSFRLCLMKLGSLTLGAYRLIVVFSFWCISPFISMECPSLSHLMNVCLKSILSEISFATPAYLQEPLAW